MTMTNREAREFISRGLESELSQLRQLSPWKRCLELATFFALWALGLRLVCLGEEHGGWLPALGTVVIALALNAFVLFLHEGMHHTLFKQRKVNDLLSVFLGGTVAISYTAYRIMHLEHHEHLGDEHDPDDYHNYTDNKKLVWLLHGVRVLAGSLLYLFLIPFKSWKLAGSEDKKRMLAEYAYIITLYAVLGLTLPTSTFCRYHLWSLLLVGFMVNLRGFTQHGLAVPEDPYLASRSIHASPVVAFLLLNENYHLEHHLFPEIPSYNLRKLHDLIWSRLPRAVKNDSYSEFLLASLKAAPKMDETPIGVIVPTNTEQGWPPS